jgi:hypothetical protein
MRAGDDPWTKSKSEDGRVDVHAHGQLYIGADAAHSRRKRRRVRRPYNAPTDWISAHTVILQLLRQLPNDVHLARSSKPFKLDC